MKRTLPGEIWRVDFGLAAKVRPALLIVVPHTTAVRGNRWELSLPKPFLKPGAFHLQQVQPVPIARCEARLGSLSSEEIQQVRSALIGLLNLGPHP